ncbi:MAG: glycosyltransferase [Deltaproteobacteria bacterium]|jgi:dolichol-phosphate mannosyltransferase|nr:glycosyltransferase [Deltaproteobacteria bacterium]
MIYVLLPIYNEAANLPGLIERIQTGIERLGFPYTVLAYNDGSTDGSDTITRELASSHPLVLLGEPENKGLGHGFASLLKEVCARSESDKDVAIVLDSDNSHNPELFGFMLEKLRQGFDVVIASRYLSDSRVVGVSWFRQFLSLGASWVMRILFPIRGVRDYTCGYRAYSLPCLRKAFDKFGDKLVEEPGFACMAEMLLKLRTLPVLAVEVPLLLRYDLKQGASKMDIRKTIKRTLRMIYRLKAAKQIVS